MDKYCLLSTRYYSFRMIHYEIYIIKLGMIIMIHKYLMNITELVTIKIITLLRKYNIKLVNYYT